MACAHGRARRLPQPAWASAHAQSCRAARLLQRAVCLLALQLPMAVRLCRIALLRARAVLPCSSGAAQLGRLRRA